MWLARKSTLKGEGAQELVEDRSNKAVEMSQILLKARIIIAL
jgi:hypothetical protein